LRLALIGGATPGLTYVGTGTFTGGVSGGTY